jgi:predicted O-methyltransferase YrrM
MFNGFGATLQFVRSGGRMPKLQRAVEHWRFLNSPLVPEVFLGDAFPETVGKRFTVTTDVRHHFELPYGERMVMSAIVNALQPRSVFEFGTYTGSTTQLIADACPDQCVVHTLDLPAKDLAGTSVADADIGSRFKGRSEYAGRIVQHRSRSLAFDYAPFEGRIDLVYVDGSHKFEDVLHDSRMGARMLSPTGVMIWDDYAVGSIPVAAALNVLTGEMNIARIFSTRLAVHRRRPS